MVEDTFVMCYDSKVARDTYYTELLDYSRRTPPRVPVRIVRGTLLTGVPYPYCVWVFCDKRDADKVDLWLVRGPPSRAPDFYAGVARAREYEEYRKRTLVKVEEVQLFGPWMPRARSLGFRMGPLRRWLSRRETWIERPRFFKQINPQVVLPPGVTEEEAVATIAATPWATEWGRGISRLAGYKECTPEFHAQAKRLAEFVARRMLGLA